MDHENKRVIFIETSWEPICGRTREIVSRNSFTSGFGGKSAAIAFQLFGPGARRFSGDMLTRHIAVVTRASLFL